MRVLTVGTAIALLTACSGVWGDLFAQSPAPPPAPDSASALPFEYVWTTGTETTVRTLAGPIVVPRLFTRLEVVGVDSLGIAVRCAAECSEPGIGIVDSTQVVHTSTDPAEAAGGELAEFILAVRDAASRRDLSALQAAMAPEFTFSLLMAGSRVAAFRAWEYDGYRSLESLAELLDRGVVSQNGGIWVAPAEYLTEPSYRGLRTGFRREGGRWVWLFLVKEEQ